MRRTPRHWKVCAKLHSCHQRLESHCEKIANRFFSDQKIYKHGIIAKKKSGCYLRYIYHWWTGNEMRYIYTTGSYSVVKNLNLRHIRKWVELGNTQSKVSQAQKDKQHTSSLTCGSSLLILCVCIWVKCGQNPKDSKGPMREEGSVRGGDSRRGRTAGQMCYKTKLKRGRDETETGEERVVGKANPK